ncbi:MAG: Holliday junction branch migration protein RuvA [Pseudomonadota bacterium]
MIGKVSGILDHRMGDHVLIDVHGIGYVVHCSERTLAELPDDGQPVSLYTDLLVREDNLQLFGFPTLLEKEWHRLLIGVQGIGAKASMAILGALGTDGVGRAIAMGDWSAVKAAPGVGPKIAQRVVNELKDKMPKIMAMGGATGAGAADANISSAGAPSAPAPPADAQADALSALVNLGYPRADAAGAVARAAGDTPEARAPALIRAALKRLAPRS